MNMILASIGVFLVVVILLVVILLVAKNFLVPMNQMNKVKNLITVHQYCHDLIHSNTESTSLSEKTLKNIEKYRNKFNG